MFAQTTLPPRAAMMATYIAAYVNVKMCYKIISARPPTPAVLHPLDGTSWQSRCTHVPDAYYPLSSNSLGP